MLTNKFRNTILGTALITLLAGCMPKINIQSIKDMQPPRPMELDRLNLLVGRWETTGEIAMPFLNQVIHTSGRNEAVWDLDRRIIIDRAHLDMQELGKLTGISLWSWNDKNRKYRMHWFDSFGESSTADVIFDEKKQTWRMKARGRKYGVGTSGRGTLHHIDANTIEWTWEEWGGLGLIKLADMHGTSRRIP